MGEGGLAPDYFFHASLYELIHYAAGVRRRYREGWLQARFVGYCACAPHCKNVEYEELIKFAWEVGEQGDEMSEAEKEAAIDRLRKNIPEIEKILKNGGKSDN